METMLQDNIGTVAISSRALIEDAANWSAQVEVMSRRAMDMIVSDCNARAAGTVEDVPCTTLRVLGRQRILLQKMSKEACLQGLSHETEANKQRMMQITGLLQWFLPRGCLLSVSRVSGVRWTVPEGDG